MSVKAPAAEARLHSPSESVPGPSSRYEYLGDHRLKKLQRYKMPKALLKGVVCSLKKNKK